MASRSLASPEKALRGVLLISLNPEDKPQGFILACLAFIFVSGRGLVILLRDTLLSFEQTRRTLAYFPP